MATTDYMAQYVNYQEAEEDVYEATFKKFAHAYHTSHDTNDGADNVPHRENI